MSGRFKRVRRRPSRRSGCDFPRFGNVEARRLLSDEPEPDRPECGFFPASRHGGSGQIHRWAAHSFLSGFQCLETQNQRAARRLDISQSTSSPSVKKVEFDTVYFRRRNLPPCRMLIATWVAAHFAEHLPQCSVIGFVQNQNRQCSGFSRWDRNTPGDFFPALAVFCRHIGPNRYRFRAVVFNINQHPEFGRTIPDSALRNQHRRRRPRWSLYIHLSIPHLQRQRVSIPQWMHVALGISGQGRRNEYDLNPQRIISYSPPALHGS